MFKFVEVIQEKV